MLWEIFMPLIRGQRVTIANEETSRDPHRLIALLESSKASRIVVVPSLLQAMLEVEDLQHRLSGLRYWACSGQALSQDLVRLFYSRLPDAELFNVYGTSEFWDATWARADRDNGHYGAPIGRPLSNMRTYVLGGDLHPVPIGAAGELYIGGVGLARGYLHRAGLTGERFVPSPYGDGERLYRTGDLVRYLSGGDLEFVGRVDHQVKIRGYRIELGEIEARLVEHGAVHQAVVLAREDMAGEKRLAAYVVAADAASADAGELRAHLKRSLPEYMVPSAYVVLEALPLTANGKIDRRALPAPEGDAIVRGEYVAPRTPTEEVLAAIWAEVLKLERVGIEDNFFELGGHSLLGTRVIARMREAFAVELPLRALFEAPTVGELAQRAEDVRRAGAGLTAPALVVQARPALLPLSYAQERLWVLEQLEAAGAAYNIAGVVRLSGALNVAALERSFVALVDRHEGLRTRFEEVAGRPVQVIDGPGGFGLEVEDLSGAADEERAVTAQRRAGAIKAEPFDLARGPLLRATLLKLSAEEHVAVMVMHHIVSDGWSMGVLIRELGALYAAFCAGQPSPLGELPVQYADYALWQRDWLQGDVLARQVKYWKDRLSGAPAALDLPIDRPRPAVLSFKGAAHGFALPAELTRGLSDLARSEGATLFMVLLAAFQVLLSRWSGQGDVVVGTPVAGRTHREVEGLIGFFVNMLALRTELSGDPSFRALLGQVRETALGAYAHQDLPFEKLVEELQPVRDLSRRPIFQVMINSFQEETLSSVEETPSSLALPKLKVSALSSGEVSARFELMLRLMESAQGVTCRFEYATDLFDGATIERLAGQFRKLLEAIVVRPEAAVSELDLLGASERRQLEEWSRTADYLSDKYIHDLAAGDTSGDAVERPLSGMRAYVLDRRLGLSPVGVFGEVYLGGGVQAGDVGVPALTAARFIPDPFGDGDRLYRTGGLARWRADGVLEWADHSAVQAGTENDPGAVAYEAPRTPLEEVIAGIWVEMLGVERVGIHDNFFTLGGHSLLGTRVIARMRDAFQLELPLRALFEAPTVCELAARVELARREGLGLIAPALVAAARPALLPLSYAQERLWLLDQIETPGSAYNLTAGARLEGRFDDQAFELALGEVVRRHQNLRTRFEVVDGSPVQVIDGAGDFVLERHEFESGAAARRWTAAYVRRPFDLSTGGLLRVAVLRLSEEEHIAIMVMHHIVSDGWSMGVLIRELGVLYTAFCAGQPSPLGELPVQYADYALWQRDWLQGDVLARQVKYWKDRLSGAPAALDLPIDRARPAVQSFRGASVSLTLPKELIEALQRVARSEGATLFMVLLAAFQVLLSRWSGQTDVVVGTPVAGRTHRELEGLIGFFINTLALRTDLSGDPSFRELVGRAKETALGAYAHQDLPFEKLVEELQPVRDLSRRPIFQVMINSFMEEKMSSMEEMPSSLALPRLKVSALGHEEVSARFELMLRLRERAQGVICRFEYATDLFDGSTIERLAGQFQKLLEEIVGRPEARVSEFELLGQAERRQLAEWSTTADYLSGKYIHDLVAEDTLCEPIERPLSTMRAYVLDRRLGLAPVGVFGELHIGGVVLPGDVGAPALTAARFIPDPFGSGDRLYRTGDLARWRADGVLEWADDHSAVQAGTQNDPGAVAYEAPRTPLEEVIAGIWVEMLGAERIGIHDNFFTLGGHSLLGTRVIARIREALAVELPLRTLFEAPTLCELAERVELARGEGLGLIAPALVAAERPALLPLSYAQERFFTLHQLQNSGSAFNLKLMVRLKGMIDVTALERSFDEVVRRHEILRTRFEVVDGSPVQVIDGPNSLQLEVLDLSHVPDGERLGEVRREAEEFRRRPFDLGTAPLLRAGLFRISATDHVAVCVMHHIISDGWSSQVLIREVGALYLAFSQGLQSPLAELPIQYGDYVMWERAWLQKQVLVPHLAYWTKHLAGAPALELPTDRPRPAIRNFRGATHPFVLRSEACAALQRLAKSERATLFMVLLTAFNVVLSRWTGQDDIVLGSPIAGRRLQETEGLIGLFMNILPLRTNTSGNPRFSDLLKRTKEVALGAYAHQDLPLGVLETELQLGRDLSREPLFRVLFALQNVPTGYARLPGIQRFGVEATTSRRDLSFFMSEISGELRGAMEYDTDIFDASTIAEIMKSFRSSLQKIVLTPELRISDLTNSMEFRSRDIPASQARRTETLALDIS